MNETKPLFDKRAFRTALGCFPTGVTVVTTLDPGGKRIGLTANSFTSVSLDPPLVLWSLAKSAASLPTFVKAPHYAINVLAADQIGLSRRFAGPHPDRFAEVTCREGLGGVPLIEGCAAWFECHNVHRYEGGDHVILVGQVERFAESDRTALAFHAGAYRITSHHPENLARPESERFIDDYLLYLLARASHLASGQFHARLKKLDMPVPHWRVLAALSDGDALTVSTLARIVLFQQPTMTKVIDRMAKLGLVERRPSATDRRQVLVHITRKGRSAVRGLLKQAKRHEAEILAGYGHAETTHLKAALRTLIERLGDDAAEG
jgi:flavin reductase (DIM6/NTAB) family NADH-FMN oxidoreductase RutF/DNA-binding MarR family transcriptional regulator